MAVVLGDIDAADVDIAVGKGNVRGVALVGIDCGCAEAVVADGPNYRKLHSYFPHHVVEAVESSAAV